MAHSTRLGYTSEPNRIDEIVEIATHPEKRYGEMHAFDNGAFIDVGWTRGKTRDAVLRVCDAFVDAEGRERFRSAADKAKRPRVGVRLFL